MCEVVSPPTHICSPDEHLWLIVRALRKGENALRVGALVCIRRQHVVQALVAKLLKEPLDVDACKVER